MSARDSISIELVVRGEMPTFDRSFLVFLQDRESGLIIAMGRVVDPAGP